MTLTVRSFGEDLGRYAAAVSLVCLGTALTARLQRRSSTRVARPDCAESSSLFVQRLVASQRAAMNSPVMRHYSQAFVFLGIVAAIAAAIGLIIYLWA